MVPPRSTHRELLDAPTVDPAELRANLADIRVINHWFGGNGAVLHALASLCQRWEGEQTLLDVATGSADVPLAVRGWARHQGLSLRVFASDVRQAVVHEARRFTNGAVPLICHDALCLPFADRSFDLITCAQTLHHLDPPDALRMLAELARVARRAVIISDLRRSWLAYVGAHLVGLLQQSAMSRHDGPLSILRAYTPVEMRQLAQQVGLPFRIFPYSSFRSVLIIEPVLVPSYPATRGLSGESPHPKG